MHHARILDVHLKHRFEFSFENWNLKKKKRRNKKYKREITLPNAWAYSQPAQ